MPWKWAFAGDVRILKNLLILALFAPWSRLCLRTFRIQSSGIRRFWVNSEILSHFYPIPGDGYISSCLLFNKCGQDARLTLINTTFSVSTVERAAGSLALRKTCMSTSQRHVLLNSFVHNWKTRILMFSFSSESQPIKVNCPGKWPGKLVLMFASTSKRCYGTHTVGLIFSDLIKPTTIQASVNIMTYIKPFLALT